MKILFILLLGGLALLVGLGLFSTYNARSHKEPAEEFLRLLGDNQPQQAFDSTTAGFREDFDWEHFSAFVDRFRLTTYQRGSLQVDSALTDYSRKRGLLVTLSGKAALRDRSSFQTTIKLRQERGRWKVDYFYVKAAKRHPQPLPSPSASPAGGIDAASDAKPPPQDPVKVPGRFTPEASKPKSDRRDAPASTPSAEAATPTALCSPGSVDRRCHRLVAVAVTCA